MRTALPLLLIILLIGAGVGYVFFTPSNSQQPDAITPSPTQQAASIPSKAVPSVKSYAALQFSVSEDQVTIVSSEKQEWQDICLDLKIPDYECTKKAISGYEVVVEAAGNQTKYRASDDGTIIRIVKTPSPESLTGAASSPSPEASPATTN